MDWRAKLRECGDDEVVSALTDAIESVFRDDDYLFRFAVHERTIAAALAFHMRPHFANWNIDAEYNKLGEDTKSVTLLGSLRKILPDIIVHRRGNRFGANRLAVEIKRGNTAGTDRDITKLRQMRRELRYEHALFIRFGDKHRAGTITDIRWIHD